MINHYDVQKTTQPPRFPKNGEAREVHDLTELCDVWAKNDGCRLDQDFYVNNQTQGFTGFVKSHDMFSFMQKTCMKSCGWAPEGENINYQTQEMDKGPFIAQVATMNMKDARSGQEMECVDIIMLASTSWLTLAGKVVEFVDFCQHLPR